MMGVLFALGLTLRFAVPRGRTRPVRARVLLRALLPRRIIASTSGRSDIAWFVFNTFFFTSTFGWAIWSGGDFVGDATEPDLTVSDLKLGADAAGGVGLWVDQGSVATFANLTVTQG